MQIWGLSGSVLGANQHFKAQLAVVPIDCLGQKKGQECTESSAQLFGCFHVGFRRCVAGCIAKLIRERCCDARCLMPD
jgi:hypothetical protein